MWDARGRVGAPLARRAAGRAALRADPEDPEALAQAIREALRQRAELVAAGLEHAGRFTWEASAGVILAALEERS